MRSLLLILFSLIVSLHAAAQPLKEINTYLKNPSIPEVAKEYYSGKIKVSEDDTSFRATDSFRTKNNDTRPFYLLLASRMMDVADGVLSEPVCYACEELFENYPEELVEFLYCGNTLIKKDFKMNWAYGVVTGVQQSHPKGEKQYLDDIHKIFLKKCKPQNRENMKAFFGLLYKGL